MFNAKVMSILSEIDEIVFYFILINKSIYTPVKSYKKLFFLSTRLTYPELPFVSFIDWRVVVRKNLVGISSDFLLGSI